MRQAARLFSTPSGHAGAPRFSRRVSLAILIAIVVLAQPPSPPAQGIQVGDLDFGVDIRFPLNVTQCEPVFIYYNIGFPTTGARLKFFSADGNTLFSISPLSGMGYLEWICNIPAGYSVLVGYYLLYPVVIQSGTSSSCLGNVTTTHQYVSYATTVWMSYTVFPPSSSTIFLLPLTTSTVSFPTGSFSTITANPELIRTPTSTPSSYSASHTPSASSHSVSPTPSTPSRKSSAPAIAGGVIGALVIAVAFSVTFIRLRKRRTRRSEMTASDQPIATSPSKVQSGWALNASAPASMLQNTSMPTSNSAITSTFNSSWDPSTLPVEVASASNTRQGEASFHSATTSVRASQAQPALRTSVEPALLRNTTASVPATHTQPASGASAEPDSTTADTVAALDMFSRLPPERMRALLPVFTDIVASQRPSEG